MLQFVIGGQDISRTASRAIGPWTTTAAVRSLFLLREPLGPKHIIGAAHAGGEEPDIKKSLNFLHARPCFGWVKFELRIKCAI